MNIRPATGDDAQHCHKLAQQVTLAASGSEDAGFLLGMETIEDYQGFLRSGIGFLAEGAAGDALGFVIAYLHDSPLVARHASALLNATWETTSPLGAPFCYIEKVAVSPQSRRQGIAQALYAHLLTQVADRPFLAAIVETPHCNRASREFHYSLGFARAGVSLRPASATQPGIQLGIYLRDARTRPERSGIPQGN